MVEWHSSWTYGRVLLILYSRILDLLAKPTPQNLEVILLPCLNLEIQMVLNLSASLLTK